jgi:hypothetical protein
VYKLIGPALVKQDMIEARSNVTKRLDFIKSELERLEKQVKEIEGRVQAKQQEVSGSTGPPCKAGSHDARRLLPACVAEPCEQGSAPPAWPQVGKLQRVARETTVAA